MMMNMGSKLIWIAILVVVAMSREVASDITCRDAIIMLHPCKEWVTGTYGLISVPCCEAVTSLRQRMDPIRPSLRLLCHCYQENAPKIGVIRDRIEHLPITCGAKNIPPSFFNPNTDCESY